MHRALYPFFKKVADKYADICGYRQHGLKYDDLIIEENETVQTVSDENCRGARSPLDVWLGRAPEAGPVPARVRAGVGLARPGAGHELG